MSDKVLLQDILEFTRDGEWGKEDSFENSRQTRVIRGTDFEDVRIGKVDGLPHRHIAKRFIEYKALKPFDVLIETAGGSKNTPTGRTLLLKPSLFDKIDIPLVCASFARFLRFDDSKVVPEYLFWHLQYLYRNGVLKQYHVQHTGVARFQFTTFKENEYLELPDRNIQKKIASILSAFDDLIENNSRRIEILEEMARRIYREWFVHFRFPCAQGSGEQAIPADGKPKLVDSGTELGEIPEGWEVKKLEDVCELTLGQSPKSEFYNEKGEGLPFHQGVRDFGDRYPTTTTWCIKDKRIAEEGDILFSVRAPVGRINIANTKMIIGRGLHSIRSKFDNQVFIFHQLKDKFKEEDSMGSGTIYKSVTKKDMLNLKLIDPGKELIEKFEEKAIPIFKQIKVLTDKNEKLKETRDLLLPKLISGKIEIKEVTVN